MDATRWTLRGLSLGMLGVLLTALPAPGMADTTVFDDPVGDSTSVDISRVRVVHRDSVTVRVRSVVPLAAGQVYAFWIDTGPRPAPTTTSRSGPTRASTTRWASCLLR